LITGIKYNLKENSKGMYGNEIRRLNTMIEETLSEHVIEFKNLGNKISEYKKDIYYKLQTYNRINGITKIKLIKQMSNKTKVRKHNVTVKAALKYGSETWVLNKIEKQHLEATQMRFLRPLLGYTKLYLQRNFDIREKLEVQKIVKEIQTFQKNWKKHVERMQDEELPQLALKYQPVGKRSGGRPKKRLKERFLKRIEEYRINKLSQRFKKKNNIYVVVGTKASLPSAPEM
jgi:hypothetical protein